MLGSLMQQAIQAQGFKRTNLPQSMGGVPPMMNPQAVDMYGQSKTPRLSQMMRGNQWQPQI